MKPYPTPIDVIPTSVSESEAIYLVQHKDVNWKFVEAIKTITDFTDDIISKWLNINIKTFRAYKQPGSVLKQNLKEHVVLLLALFKHGTKVFGSSAAFDGWLGQPNFYFDNKNPLDYMNTISGIRFIDSRLTAMEYGDNV